MKKLSQWIAAGVLCAGAGVAFAQTLGQGLSAVEGRGPAAAECRALAAEVLAVLEE